MINRNFKAKRQFPTTYNFQILQKQYVALQKGNFCIAI